jgi:hypothetical protein
MHCSYYEPERLARNIFGVQPLAAVHEKPVGASARPQTTPSSPIDIDFYQIIKSDRRTQSTPRTEPAKPHAGLCADHGQKVSRVSSSAVGGRRRLVELPVRHADKPLSVRQMTRNNSVVGESDQAESSQTMLVSTSQGIRMAFG